MYCSWSSARTEYPRYADALCVRDTALWAGELEILRQRIPLLMILSTTWLDSFKIMYREYRLFTQNVKFIFVTKYLFQRIYHLLSELIKHIEELFESFLNFCRVFCSGVDTRNTGEDFWFFWYNECGNYIRNNSKKWHPKCENNKPKANPEGFYIVSFSETITYSKKLSFSGISRDFFHMNK